MKRILLVIAAILAALLFLGMIWEPLRAERVDAPKPLRHDARIVRDEFGVPHIFGRTDADTAYGLAYAHAEDDFETIQEVLAMTRGRTGALNGEKGAPVDFVLELLEARQTAEVALPAMPGDVQAMLDGYARGLNLYARRHPEEVRLSNLFPVNGKDVATGFVLRSPFFFGVDDTIKALSEGSDLPVSQAAPMTPAGTDPDMNGSNAFAVAPKRMADGRTWLISNSHQPYEGGVAWYEAVVHSDEGLDMAGALFPGSPFVLLGHNRNLGWTNTVNRPDLIDVYKLVLNDAGDSYRYDGEWLPLEKRRIWLAVKFGPFNLPVPKTLYRSKHGPVLINEKGAFAIRYAGIGEAKMLEQYYRITKARDFAEWTRAMAIGGIPATNFIYADKTGRIAFFYNAQFPARTPGFEYGGVLPGDTSRAVWQGALPFDRAPRLIDPASGFVQNANNTPYLAAGEGSEMRREDYSLLLGIEERMTNRGMKAVELLSADASITPDELLAIKYDTGYSQRSFAGVLMQRIAALDLKGEADLAKAQALLARWDWTSDGKGHADVLAEMMIHGIARKEWRKQPWPDLKDELRKAVDRLTTDFGRIDPPYADVQRLRRGTVDLPMDGGQDTLRAAAIWDPQPDGRMRVRHGDSFLMLVNWDKQGRVTSRSIQPYGAATTRPKSPHYTDQMKLFVAKQTKPVHFERADLIKHAKRAYRP